MVLRRKLGLKKEDVTGEWRRQHDEELYRLYSPNIIRTIISRIFGCARHVAHMADRRVTYSWAQIGGYY